MKADTSVAVASVVRRRRDLCVCKASLRYHARIKSYILYVRYQVLSPTTCTFLEYLPGIGKISHYSSVNVVIWFYERLVLTDLKLEVAPHLN